MRRRVDWERPRKEFKPGPLDVASLLVGATGLGVRLLWRFHRINKGRAKAAKMFEKELVRQGMPAHRAALLRSDYEQATIPALELGKLLGPNVRLK